MNWIVLSIWVVLQTLQNIWLRHEVAKTHRKMEECKMFAESAHWQMQVMQMNALSAKINMMEGDIEDCIEDEDYEAVANIKAERAKLIKTLEEMQRSFDEFRKTHEV